MKKIKLLFKIGYAYHKAAFDPIIELLLNNPNYDVWFSLDMETIKRFIFEFPYRDKIIEDWVKLGYRFTQETRGFDIVIAGDTLRNAEAYGKTLLIFLNHGTGIKNILYRNLAKAKGHKYQIFVEGTHRVDSLTSC
ncbi:MAG: CDP-glycerol glycerophosphotransferase, partial [Candidatus Cloacimonetes bacterium]|nr:CDP-glycerol glycerophosphotransferase [Candidatus Cloacimonadota bacterium]